MDIGNFIKKNTNDLSEGSLNVILINPIFVAILITTIIMLLVVSLYSDCTQIKTSFYIFLTTTFIVFIHNRLLLIEHRKQLCDKASGDICDSIDTSLTKDLNFI